MVGLCLGCQSSRHGVRECEKVRYNKGLCCYRCGLPQRAFGEHIHGDADTGECEAGLEDVMKGICWRVFRDSILQERYLGDEIKWDRTEEWFRRWIAGADMSGEMTNGCKLMLRVWR